jgi:hypothetical protein
MSYVDGVFSGRRSKGWALGTLALAAAASFALGWVRDMPREADVPAQLAYAEPGVMLARPVADLPPEPLLQAAAEPKPAPARRRSRAPVEVAEATVADSEPVAMAEPADPAAALSVGSAATDAASVQPLEVPDLERR